VHGALKKKPSVRVTNPWGNSVALFFYPAAFDKAVKKKQVVNLFIRKKKTGLIFTPVFSQPEIQHLRLQTRPRKRNAWKQKQVSRSMSGCVHNSGSAGHG